MAEFSSEEQFTPRSPDEISEDEKNSFKLIKMAYSTARLVLYTIFKWGTFQESGQTVEDYLLNTKGYTSTKYRKYFDVSQRQKMSDKSLESSFDITHLVKLMYHTSDKLEQEYTGQDENRLEWLLMSVKNFRNAVSHSNLGVTKEELILKAAEVMGILKKALSVAGVLYNRDPLEVQRMINKMVDDLKNIRDQTLVPSDLSQYEVLVFYEKLRKILKEEGGGELKARYKNCSQLNPVSFLEGKRVMLTIDTVFTQIEVESAGTKVRGTLVPCNDIIVFCRTSSLDVESGNIPRHEVYIIEGPAGSGKTTLLKHMKHQWSSPTCCTKGLEEFDLLLVMDCRNRSLSSFSQLLGHLLPNTSAKYFREGELQKFVLGLKVLLLVDGLDELNSSSEKLFLEILNLKSANLVVFCTSRPEKVSYFQLHVTIEFQTAHLRIIGIADHKREEFVVKYHNEMLRVNLSIQDTDKLLQYMRKSLPRLQRHFRLPLNLVILVWLWADDPSLMTAVTSSSELYLETLTLMKKKLIERLIHNETTMGVDLDTLNERVTVFVTSMCREALVSLRWDMIEKFLPESVMLMKTTCNTNSLPSKEVMSAFLVINTVEGEEQVSMPHKLMHEFYASLWIRQSLLDENKEADNSAFLQELASFLEAKQVSPTVKQNFLSDALKRQSQTVSPQKPGAIRAILTDLHKEDPDSLKLIKYRSLLVQVAGVLYAHGGKRVEECTAEEIVELLKESKFGIKDNNEWFDLLDNVKNDNTILRLVSSHITKNLTITEDRIEVALILLDSARPSEIKVSIACKSDSISHFTELIEKIANCNSQFDLYFRHDFKHPSAVPANDEQLMFAAARCQLGEFLGHIGGETLATLPNSTQFLNLAVSSDEQAAGLLKCLREEASSHSWVSLCLHITSAVSSSSLCQMPEVSMLWLLLSDVDDAGITRVCDIMTKMLPPESMFVDIRFPGAEVTVEGWKQLVAGLIKDNILVGHITVPEEIGLTDDEYYTLKDMAHSHWRCDFRRYSEDQIWESVLLAM